MRLTKKTWKQLNRNNKSVVYCAFLLQGAINGLIDAKFQLTVDKEGYLIITAVSGTRRHTARFHRVVGYFLWGNSIFRKVVCHLDGDKLNFAPTNLYLGTHKNNSDHAIVHGTKIASKDKMRKAHETWNRNVNSSKANCLDHQKVATYLKRMQPLLDLRGIDFI